MRQEPYRTYGGSKLHWCAKLYAPGMLIGGPAFSEVFGETKAECRRKAEEAISRIESEQEDGPETFYVQV